MGVFLGALFAASPVLVTFPQSCTFPYLCELFPPLSSQVDGSYVHPEEPGKHPRDDVFPEFLRGQRI